MLAMRWLCGGFLFAVGTVAALNDAPQRPLAGGSNAERRPRTFDAAFTEYLEKIAEHYHISSLVAAMVDGEETFLKAWGTAILPDVPTTEDTLYYVGSTTKSFTATSLLAVLDDLQHQESRSEPVTLQTRISSIIPDDFVLPDTYATAHATIEDALAHRLGFIGHDLCYGGPNYTVRDVVRALRHLPMAEELRAKFQYLNIGYMIVQHVVETLTGKFIGDVHKERIWDPLGMDSTFITLDDALASEKPFAHGYSWNPFNKTQGHQPWTDTTLVGGGGIITSIKDFGKYLHALVHRKLPLPGDLQDELFKPRMIVGSKGVSDHMSDMLYGLGWDVTSYRGHRLIQHSGEISGFSSNIVFLPEKKFGLAMMINADDNGGIANNVLCLYLLERFLEIPEEDWEDIVPHWDEVERAKLDFFLHARDILYPGVPSPPIPPSLPLGEYAGTYSHPAYREITLELREPRAGLPLAKHTKEVLHTDIRRLVNVTVDLEHVSGEFFAAWTDLEVTAPFVRGAVPAQFEIGSDGKVQKMGLQFEIGHQSQDKESLVWFDKL
ncbi:putative penicillin-binding protein [Phaeoacremonium minimum UCRPA7]|uniref:Putative penicillin-binding protein n=1 Tax=Phaeoacremonium minimum (strain UCR-PA7) TaxID=1286976 RepID=R8BCU4_PHAM7|nr:putative penicillin-binding protein [Phaeoacremonium minimum UCRPA7]EON97129.1 putative penicillin-binding protein [Phaeoacremonium minimum UCRPA7]